MLRKLPKITLVPAAVHLAISLCFLGLLSGYIFLAGGNKLGHLPDALLIPMVLILYVDYPISLLVETLGWGLSGLAGPWAKLAVSLMFVVLGTAMWFLVGMILNKLLTFSRRK